MDMLPPAWVLVIVAVLSLLYLWGTWSYGTYKKYNIPFVDPVPFIGNMGPFVLKKKSFGDIFKDTYNQFKGHGLIGFFQFMNPVVLVCNPDLIKMIVVKDFEHFTDHVTPIKEEDDPLFGKFLFALRGERWKFMRHTLSPAFTSSKMKSMFLLVAECGEQLGEYLEKKCKDAGGRLTLDTKDLFTRFANDVIATSAFGIHCDSLQQPTNEFYMMGKDAVNFGGAQALKFFGFLFSPALMRLLNVTFIKSHVNKFFLSLVTGTMAQREKENIVRPDMIHLLMQARKETLKADANDGGGAKTPNQKIPAYTELTDADITAQAFLFFVAGFDTASTHLCFLIHLLATHPDVMKRVQEEIDTILAEDGGKITYDGVQRMKYTDMVISEVLRLWPPAVATDRRCVKDYVIPATDTSPRFPMKVGDNITIPIWGLHRDPDYFEDPDRFDPERFSDENKNNIKPFTYLPFGAGPRICIGMRFAVMETKIALASVLSRFDLEVVPKTAKTLILNKDTFNMGVEGGFWIGIKPRVKTA